MIKYYFAYNTFNGKVFPVKWMEEDGKPVGGKPSQTTTPKEIPEEEFVSCSIAEMQMIYPYYLDDAEVTGKV